jgi:hypothetical protein
MTGAARGVLDRLLVVAALLGAMAFVSQALPPFAILPESEMNASRVTPAVALARGQGVYAGPDHGAVIDFMYGPMAAIAFLPSALASSPSGTLAIAGVLNLIAFFVPMAWLLASELPRPVALASFLCFALLVSYDLGLSFSAFTIHADAPALGLCAAACLAHLSGVRAAPALSAACAVLAVWTKQPAAPIVLALPLYALLTGGPREGARHALWLAALGIVSSLLFVLVFGYRDMVFNMFTLPGRMPWYGEAEHGRTPAALNSLRLLALQNRWPAALLAILAAISARGAGGVWRWLGAHRWTLLALVGLLMAPTAVLGGAKIGGYLNTHSFTNYFVLGAATLALGEAAARAGSPARRPAAALLLALLVALAIASLASPRQERAVRGALARLRAWRTNPQQQAYDFARAHPGEVWFPWNPLASLQAEGRLYHSEIGIWNRELVGMEMSEANLRRHLPPAMRWLAFRPPTGALTWLPPANHHLPAFREPVAVPGLEGWVVYGRAERDEAS